jgi:elongation factor 1-gamma
MTLTLLAPKGSPRTNKVLIAAKYLGVTLEHPDFKMGVDNKTKEYLELNPLGQVPVLKTPEGPISESQTILRYLSGLGNKSLTGKNAREAILVDQWMEFSTTQLEPNVATWLYPILGYRPNNKEATNAAKGNILKLLGVLNSYLEPRTFFVGERISLADIALLPNLWALYTTVLDAGLRKKFTNLNRYFLTLVNQPNVKEFFGETTLCVKMAVAKEPEPKKEENKEPAKPQPKAAKPAQDEDEAPKEEKPKSKLDLLPKSSMDLDEWKRTYSNNDTRPVALDWLWKNFDASGYSFYFCEYKYNSELTKVFMTSNLIGGWFQRLDRLRKYGFGSVLIFGEEGQLSISGVWIFRGSEIPEEMSVCDDSELYTWTKLDHTDADTKTKIENYFAWDGFATEKFADGKVFK